jgi:NAD(P)H-hydrate epimerase
MAVGGSGDVLSGILTALLGQGIEPLEATACGAYLHGAAGDLCAKELGQYGMLPTDMLNVLPRLLK